MRTVRTIAAVFICLVCGCTAKGTGTTAILQPRTAGTEVRSEYRVQPGDLLDVKFFYNPELNEQVVVRSDGKISLQLVGDVTAAGLTPAQLKEHLNRAYSSDVLDPKITVIVRTPVADKVYVDGEVNRAGLVPINGTLTAVQSIAQAGGMKETANAKQVVIIRRDVDNNLTKISVNVEEMRKNGTGTDVVLRPDDIVYVPKSTIADVNSWIDLYIRKNVPLPVGLGYSIR